MTDSPAPLDDLAAVLTLAGDLVAAVQPTQWDAPTPCPEWTVRELVTHMVIGRRLFTGILRGEASVTAGALDPRPATCSATTRWPRTGAPPRIC